MARKNKGKKTRRGVSKKQVEKIALSTAYKMIPKKIFSTHGTDLGPGVINNAAPWVVIQPTLLDHGFGNFNRASDQVYVEKCKGYFNVSFSTATTNRVEIRELVGFYKGSTDPSDKNTADFAAHTLSQMLPTKMSSWDRDNFYIKHDKSYDLMPQQVYNAGTGTGNNEPQGIWRSKRIPLSQFLYRKFRYTNSIEGSDIGQNTVEGQPAINNHVVGWKPFIALQVRCPDQDFTGQTGNNPGPYLDYQFRTEFKDLQ